ncbi:uncharacterized protein PHACADRAFT_250116 [Phanerochaete carnosa HHB-10118-sp]|uniref:MIF4G domain-containing protein n=1 Tax=Phanerochaete carnosa (strain HHB-10118-sp) TaxID=650164 RepID=K5X9H4_PHACS|nr:uncharacterized protein PHACADRAFT_250116 [Phanerochaete carnosa HHB-10118-sp]EKM59547.1 hypothetical protein PHACADRAFT_250116 [Phanerochaete carnosa HHB-10118-sp]
MSYNGGGYRRRNRDFDHDRREPVHESPEQNLRTSIIRLGEVDPDQELPRLVEQICETVPVNISHVSESIRIAVTEQPFKIPHYATLIRLLHDRPVPGEESSTTSLGRQVLEDFWKGFQAYLDKLLWRDTRLCVHFFAHLAAAKVVSPQSIFDLLKSFTTVLDEFGVSHGRAKQAALCAAEGLMISGAEIKASTSANVSEITSSIQSYIESISDSKALVQPTVKLYSANDPIETADEMLEAALAALQILNSSDFAQTADIVLQPYTTFPVFEESSFELPSVLVPPEVIELDTLSTDTGEDAQTKKEEWPEYYMRLFDNDISPDPTTPVGYAIRAGLLDLVDIFEINRKECARLLLEFPKWVPHGTFKPRPGAPPQDPVVGKDWQLESTVIETILGTLFLLPDPQHKAVYYIALITELCKLSPSTVGPAVGKSIRKLYGLLSDGLDVALACRFIDWFAVHMSNFGFQWVWKEWISDLDLSMQHPKRVFMRNAIEYEIRLSYYDRIIKILPEPMQNPDNRLVPSEAPGPDYEYDDPARPHYDAAQSILNLLRGRAKAEDVMSHLESLKNTLETTDSDTNVDSVIRSIAVQSLLHIGSRSFSHFLNAIERYLPLLRNLASGSISTTSTSSLEARMDILTAVSDFWSSSKHMIIIVFDKLMQYQIVDPTDVVSWAFTQGVERIAASTHSSIGALQWEVIKSALDKANGRVVIARRKVSALRKEADEKAAMAIVSNGASMEVDAEAKPDVPEPESPALTTALKAFATLTREQKLALSRTLDGFVDCLASATNPNLTAKSVISANAWHNRANWSEAEWVTWCTWGWYRHFCRLYSPYLRNYAMTLGTVSFAKVGNAGDTAVDTFRKTWNVATGQDV